MKSLFESFIVAFSMYSKIPMPHIEWSEKSMKYSICFFPWIGLVIGLLEYLWFLLCGRTGASDLLRSSIAVVIPLLVTGGIHFDGFLDTTDALSSWRTREERLRILKDSHVGAFAVIGACVFFLIALGFASEVSGKTAACLCLMFAVSRSYSAISVVSFPNANPKGTAAAFGSHARKRMVRRVMIVYLAALYVCLILIDPLAGIFVIAGSVLAFLIYYRTCMHYFGGMTGDLAGFFVSGAELLMLILAVSGDGIGRIWLRG